VEHDLSERESIQLLRTYAQIRPFPVAWTDHEILKRLGDAEKAVVRGAALVVPDVNIDRLMGHGSGPNVGKHCLAPAPTPVSVQELLEAHPMLRPPVIEGLLRRGETMNIIAAPKAGKSWLATDLALCLATGRPWLETFDTVRGDVLIIDNELHAETTANRIPKVAVTRGVGLEEVGENVFTVNLRGRLRDIFALDDYFRALDPDRFQVIILDAFYRLIPRDTDENDNGAMANIYNYIDHLVDRVGSSFVLIHHTSKGIQSGKAVTDVGAGAGSQSRATDTHLVMRPHEEPDAVVLEAAVRSWPPVDPVCLRWAFPVWTRDESLDPTALRSERPRRRNKENTKSTKPPEPDWNSETFVETFLHDDPQGFETIFDMARREGLSERSAKRLLRRAEDCGLVYRWEFAANRPVGFSKTKQPSSPEMEAVS